MALCKTVDFIYAALPLRPLRDYLIRRHMEACPLCQARLVSRAEARSMFVAPEEIGDNQGLWRRLSSRVGPAAAAPDRQPTSAGAGWRWAVAMALAFAMAVTGFWLLREIEKPGFDASSVRPADLFQIDYVNVGGAPAQTFVYQPRGTDTVFVWVQKYS